MTREDKTYIDQTLGQRDCFLRQMCLSAQALPQAWVSSGGVAETHSCYTHPSVSITDPDEVPPVGSHPLWVGKVPSNPNSGCPRYRDAQRLL